MASPTEQAQYHFRSGHGKITNTLAGEGDSIPQELREGLQHLMQGLSQLAAGTRATYMLLEEVKAEVAGLKAAAQRGGRP
jgi:hypothetical protein